MQTELVFSGFGGQGVMFAGQLLTYAAMDVGKEVTWIPSYGPEMRGGTAHCFVVISDEPIGSPIVAKPQIAIVFNNPSFDKYAESIAEDGLIVVNESLIDRKSHRCAVYIPASEIADDIGTTKLTNMVLLGATLQLRPIIKLDDLIRAINVHISEHHRDMLSLNIRAIKAGSKFSQTIQI